MDFELLKRIASDNIRIAESGGFSLDDKAALYKAATVLAPEDFNHSFKLANLYQQQGLNMRASAEFLRAAAINPQSDTAYEKYIECRGSLNDYSASDLEAAITRYKKTFDVSAPNVSLSGCFNLADTQLLFCTKSQDAEKRESALKEAFETCRIILQRKSDHTQAHFLMGKIQEAQEDMQFLALDSYGTAFYLANHQDQDLLASEIERYGERLANELGESFSEYIPEQQPN